MGADQPCGSLLSAPVCARPAFEPRHTQRPERSDRNPGLVRRLQRKLDNFYLGVPFEFPAPALAISRTMAGSHFESLAYLQGLAWAAISVLRRTAPEIWQYRQDW